MLTSDDANIIKLLHNEILEVAQERSTQNITTIRDALKWLTSIEVSSKHTPDKSHLT
jgi:hypothetical protein